MRRPVLLLLVCACAAVGAGPARAGTVGPGTDLLRNPGAQAGAASAGGGGAVAIPGWRVRRGRPTVVRYGTPGVPARGGGPRGQMFAGGAGGTAVLTQRVPLVDAVAGRYRLSARLGASSSSDATVTVRLVSAVGRVLVVRHLAPVHGRHRAGAARMVTRTLSGHLPADANRALVTITLATSLKDSDGPDAPRAGVDRAVADDLVFSLDGTASLQPPLRAPRIAAPPPG